MSMPADVALIQRSRCWRCFVFAIKFESRYMSTRYDVYGVGNSLVDIQARISDSVLEKLSFPKGIMTLVDEATQTKVLESLHSGAL